MTGLIWFLLTILYPSISHSFAILHGTAGLLIVKVSNLNFQIRNSLEQHFSSCGEITRISIPKDYESGAVKGYVVLLSVYTSYTAGCRVAEFIGFRPKLPMD